MPTILSRRRRCVFLLTFPVSLLPDISITFLYLFVFTIDLHVLIICRHPIGVADHLDWACLLLTKLRVDKRRGGIRDELLATIMRSLTLTGVDSLGEACLRTNPLSECAITRSLRGDTDSRLVSSVYKAFTLLSGS